MVPLNPTCTAESRKHSRIGKHRRESYESSAFARSSLLRYRLFGRLPSDSVHFVDTRRNSKQLPAEVAPPPCKNLRSTSTLSPWWRTLAGHPPFDGCLSRGAREKARENRNPSLVNGEDFVNLARPCTAELLGRAPKLGARTFAINPSDWTNLPAFPQFRRIHATGRTEPCRNRKEGANADYNAHLDDSTMCTGRLYGAINPTCESLLLRGTTNCSYADVHRLTRLRQRQTEPTKEEDEIMGRGTANGTRYRSIA